MRSPLLLLGMLIVGLAFIYWYTCEVNCVCFGPAKTTTVASKPNYKLTLKDDGKTLINVIDGFKFGDSSNKPYLSNPTDKGCDQLVSYTKDNDAKSITVTGSYHPDEKNNSKFPTLGLARAEAVKNLLVQKGMPADRINTADRKLGSRSSFYTDTLFNGVNFKIDTKRLVSKEVEENIKAESRILRL